jgi:neutral ceramidase
MNIKAGFGKNEIQIPEFNIGMMGYGHAKNIAKTQSTPLYSRSLIVEQNLGTEKSIVVFCVVEICFISMAMKDAVLQELKTKIPEVSWDYHNVVLSAQHTHSAPGGYTHYPFWNFTIPGFRPKTFHAIKKSIIESIFQAYALKEPAIFEFGSHQIDETVPVAFNRSINAVKNNPEYSQSLFNLQNPIDRNMEILLVKRTNGDILGCLNFFGVHTTSVPNRNTSIHYDNKGVAAELWEKKHPNAIALYAQKPAGDVSPNYIYEQSTQEMRGPYLDGIKNAEFNGELQFKESLLTKTSQKNIDIKSTSHIFKNFAEKCSIPAHGLAFFLGTLDGRGIPEGIGKIIGVYLKFYQSIQKFFTQDKKFFNEQGKKLIFLDHRDKKFLGIPYQILQYVPFAPSPGGEIGKQTKLGSLKSGSWVTHHLPIQIINLGSIVLLCTPGEITTFAGNRLKNAMQKYYPSSSIIVWSYCNAYMGYITTPEEYDIQCYEGGHTVFGRNTLPYLIECFELLAQNKLQNDQPPQFPENELALRSYA